MRKLILFLFTICVSLMQMANAQTITGKVTGAGDGAPLPGVNISIKGSTKGALTDMDGVYKLEVSGQDAVLVFSFVGFATQEVVVGTQTTIDVLMQIDAETKDEVVVVGYGTQKRSEVTGAISSVSSAQITALPVLSADQALQGRASGVTVINNGSPGTAPTIRIRGLSTMNANDPLVVIDGVVATGMGDLNPSDIETVQVLKDASTTAIYGSKGSNGVIMITTKKGVSGKVKVDYDSYWGQQWNNNRYEVMNTAQYLEYAKSSDVTSPPPIVADPQYASRAAGAETNWQDQIFKKGFMQNYNVGVSGGSENSTFRTSMGYIKQEGVMIGTNYDRFNFRVGSDFKLFGGKVVVGENVALSSSLSNPLNASGGRTLIEHAIKMAPYLPVYNPANNGGYQGPNSGVDGQDAENPVRIALLNKLDTKTINITGGLYAEIQIIEGLKFKTFAGIEAIRLTENDFYPTYNDDGLNGGATHNANVATIRKNWSNYTSKIYTQSLTYKKTIADKHNLELLGVMEYSTTDRAYANINSKNGLSNLIEQISNTDNASSSAMDEYRRIGYLGRLNYNFDSKYLIAASIRRDGSSRLWNNRWGTFPSVALGWKINNESFMQNISAISNLKIRGSWGKTGNDLIGNYRYSTTYSSNYNYVIDNVAVTGVGQGDPENKDLKWETSTKSNIGLDLGILNNQLTASVEYYSNQSDDLLLNVPLPSSLGGGSVTKNLGSTEVKGYELELGYNDFEGDFQWSASLNLGKSKTKVLELGVAAVEGAFFEDGNITRLTKGETMFYFYGWQFDGIFATQADATAYLNGGQSGARGGDFKIVDTNGDGIINDNDRTKIGNPFPDFTMGLNLSANYKGFDLGIFIQGSYGNDVYNTNIYDLEGMPRLFNSGTAVMRRWKQDGDITDIPRAGTGRNVQISSRFVEDGSYTRLKNLTLGYTLPKTLFGDKISKLRVYISAQNMVTLTKYSGLDPEVGYYPGAGGNQGFLGSQGGNGVPQVNFSTGVDYGNYPTPKSFIGGLQITF